MGTTKIRQIQPDASYAKRDVTSAMMEIFVLNATKMGIGSKIPQDVPANLVFMNSPKPVTIVPKNMRIVFPALWICAMIAGEI